jgi:hypothetical protein
VLAYSYPVFKFGRLNLLAIKGYFLDKSKEILPKIIYFTFSMVLWEG